LERTEKRRGKWWLSSGVWLKGEVSTELPNSRTDGNALSAGGLRQGNQGNMP
jgi:hypothetical protein